jgi:hypothetical protein
MLSSGGVRAVPVECTVPPPGDQAMMLALSADEDGVTVS